jgi:hypothetical protein
LEWSVAGGLPAGVSIVPLGLNPGTEPDQIVQDFEITLPLGQDTDFDLNMSAFSREVSNGDEESKTVVIPIELESNSNVFTPEFLATDQSIWSSGAEFVFDDDRFLGIDESFSDSGSVLVVDYSVSASVKAGFQSTLHFEGGQIDADLDYNVTINTNYNKTTDVLQLDPLFSLLSGTFSTTGPEGSYKLDFIFNYNIAATVGLDLVVDSFEIASVDSATISART